MRVIIEARVSDTEVADRVRRAILNLFPGSAESEIGKGTVTMENGDVQYLFSRINEQKILDTARAILVKSAGKDAIVFHLNKQAAYSGRVNFTDGDSPLGDLKVCIMTDEPREFIISMTGGRE